MARAAMVVHRLLVLLVQCYKSTIQKEGSKVPVQNVEQYPSDDQHRGYCSSKKETFQPTYIDSPWVKQAVPTVSYDYRS
jgi:hypothetical protein